MSKKQINIYKKIILSFKFTLASTKVIDTCALKKNINKTFPNYFGFTWFTMTSIRLTRRAINNKNLKKGKAFDFFLFIPYL